MKNNTPEDNIDYPMFFTSEKCLTNQLTDILNLCVYTLVKTKASILRFTATECEIKGEIWLNKSIACDEVEILVFIVVLSNVDQSYVSQTDKTQKNNRGFRIYVPRFIFKSQKKSGHGKTSPLNMDQLLNNAGPVWWN